MSEREKFSDSLSTRVPPALKARVARLCRKVKVTESDVVRYPLEQYWPETEAHFLSRAGRRARVSPALAKQIAEAEQLGVDVPALLTAAVSAASQPSVIAAPRSLFTAHSPTPFPQAGD